MPSTPQDRESAHPWLLRLAIIAVALAIALFVRSRIGDSDYRIVEEPHRLTLMDVAPLEPPEEEIELEPENPEELVELDEIEPVDDFSDEPAPPLGDILGLDAAGVAGSDAFGLAARRGGRDLLGSAGSDSLSNNWYASALTSELQKHLLPLLERHEDLRSSAYSVVLRIWLEGDGRIRKFRLTSTGDAALDRQLRAAVEEFDGVNVPPPAEMPQPVRVRVLCRN